MSLPPKQKKSQPAWLDIGVLAFVLAFLCFSVHSFLVSSQRAAPAAVKKEVLPVVETPSSTDSPTRLPASQSAPTHAGGSTEVLRLPCLNQAAKTFSSQARLLQIHAPTCGEDLKQASSWKGSNESSGEEILVFVNPKEKTLSTSYFSLKEGVNKIVFTHVLAKGAPKVQILEVSRSGAE